MIPLFFVKVDEFPLNANGKIDRLALKEPDASMFKTGYVPPESETEKLLCEKFEEVLNCGKVGIKDSFFDLGGDSIKVIKLQSICNISKLSTKSYLTEKLRKILQDCLKIQQMKKFTIFFLIIPLPRLRTEFLLNVPQIRVQQFTTFPVFISWVKMLT